MFKVNFSFPRHGYYRKNSRLVSHHLSNYYGLVSKLLNKIVTRVLKELTKLGFPHGTYKTYEAEA